MAALAAASALAAGPEAARAATAPANDPSGLGARIVGALAKVQSFRLEMSGPTGSGVAGTMTVEVPTKRMRLIMAGGTVVSESISADGKVYTRMNGGAWSVHDLAPDASSDPGMVQSMLDATHIRALPDRTEDGKVLGVYQITLAPPVGTTPQSIQAAMTCTYDKATYLPRTCANGFISEAFTGWNDPANTIVVPAVSSPPPPRSH
ncbi:MAG TPA: hypothetical protein VMD91_16985 [Candidatus Sulfotelmatobacter sp.]|nr:hypothetical protein [Candidatus Sulfotelmatobacter sp.]